MNKNLPKKQKKRKLTLRQQRLRKKVLEGKTSVTQAMLDSGYKKTTAGACQKETLEKLGIVELMEKMGITDEKLTSVISGGLNAQKESGLTGKELPDWQSRHRFTDTALKLKNKYPAEKKEISGVDGLPIAHKIIVEFLK